MQVPSEKPEIWVHIVIYLFVWRSYNKCNVQYYNIPVFTWGNTLVSSTFTTSWEQDRSWSLVHSFMRTGLRSWSLVHSFMGTGQILIACSQLYGNRTDLDRFHSFMGPGQILIACSQLHGNRTDLDRLFTASWEQDWDLDRLFTASWDRDWDLDCLFTASWEQDRSWSLVHSFMRTGLRSWSLVHSFMGPGQILIACSQLHGNVTDPDRLFTASWDRDRSWSLVHSFLGTGLWSILITCSRSRETPEGRLAFWAHDEEPLTHMKTAPILCSHGPRARGNTVLPRARRPWERRLTRCWCFKFWSSSDGGFYDLNSVFVQLAIAVGRSRSVSD